MINNKQFHFNLFCFLFFVFCFLTQEYVEDDLSKMEGDAQRPKDVRIRIGLRLLNHAGALLLGYSWNMSMKVLLWRIFEVN